MPSDTIALYWVITEDGLMARSDTSARSEGSVPAPARKAAAACFSSGEALAVTGPDPLMSSRTRSALSVAAAWARYSVSRLPDPVLR